MVMAAGGNDGACFISGGMEETGADWMTAPVELSQPKDSSKVVVVVEMFFQVRPSECIVGIWCCG